MFKAIGAICAAAAIAAGFAFATGTTGRVAAATQVQPAVVAAAPVAAAPAQACSRGWPYVDAACLKAADGKPAERRVRVVGVDRI